MPECPVCLVQYATSPYARQPRLLGCGHTLCSKCLSILLRRRRGDVDLSCPCCRSACKEPERGFPLNFALIEALEEVVEEKKEVLRVLPLTSDVLEIRKRRTMTPQPAASRRSVCEQSRSSTPPATPTIPTRACTGADIIQRALSTDINALKRQARGRDRDKQRTPSSNSVPTLSFARRGQRASLLSVDSPDVREVYKIIEKACGTPLRPSRACVNTHTLRYSELLRR
eukprot:TRINITY_DN11420_c0_g1_i1.p1 TRINITY_DN11420_c0_g1~~TRINITY_DN11420_c0_g1_i1.p1  ORF type:complete len:235 (+),score=37.88 TRINITY_DN11420_c0_g1_i1:23-706(+)